MSHDLTKVTTFCGEPCCTIKQAREAIDSLLEQVALLEESIRKADHIVYTEALYALRS